MKLIHNTTNGQVFQCPGKAIHLEFKNIAIRLSRKEFKFILDSVNEIDPEVWVELNQNSPYKRKIQMPIGSPKFLMIFNLEEFLEFRQLINSVEPCLEVRKLGIDSDCNLN